MRNYRIRSIVTGVAAAILLSTTPKPANGQTTEPAGSALDLLDDEAKAKIPTGPAPHLPDGKPDFSGVWGADGHFMLDISEALKKGENLPLQAWALKATAERTSTRSPSVTPSWIGRTDTVPSALTR